MTSDERPVPAPDAERVVLVQEPLDLRLVLGIHQHGRWDPTIRFEASGSAWRATRTAAGPATLFVQAAPGAIRARAWGPGAAIALAGLEALLGLDDEPAALVPRHPAVADAVRRLPGLRIGRTEAVLEALIPAILEQKITGDEARRTYVALIRDYGEPAPGPAGLRLQPSPEVLAGLPYHAFHPLGLERRRAELIRAVARDASRLERLAATAGPGRRPGARLRRPARVPWDRPVDGRRGRDPGVRRPGRGEHRRLPPAEHGRLGAGRASPGAPTSGCSSCWSHTAGSAVG